MRERSVYIRPYLFYMFCNKKMKRMKKNNLVKRTLNQINVYEFKKYLLSLGLSFSMMIIFTCTVIGSVMVQTQKVNLNLKNVEVSVLFNEIHKQTDLNFIFNSEQSEIVKKISVKAKNETVSNVLSRVFRNTALQFKFDGDLIIINTKVLRGQDNLKHIKGVVLNANGNGISGATVKIKGTLIGVATDINGKFKISTDKSNVVLVFSFIGFESKELAFKGQNSIRITLFETEQSLDEIVITGYQKIEKRRLTSSIVSLKGDKIVEPVATSLDQMLQGKLAGVTVLGNTSTPGASTKIRIRGTSSITGNREPVWVVDGVILEDPVPLSSEELNSMDKVNLIGNAIPFLNPEDIDRIDVLKDASATAIYGIKAANGVISITTKKGKMGAPIVTYSGTLSLTMRPSYNNLKRMNSKDRIDVSQEMQDRGLQFSGMNPGNVGYEGALMSLWNKEISYDEFNKKVKYLKEANTDWFDLLFCSPVSNNQNISISGGSKNSNYYFSAGYSDTKGTTKDVDYTKYNAMLKLTTILRSNLKFGINLNTSFTNNKRPNSSIDMYEYAYNTSRAIPAYNEDGTYAFYTKQVAYNPSSFGAAVYPPIQYNILDELGKTNNKTKNSNISVTFNLDYKILNNLSFNSVINVSRSNSRTTEVANDNSYYSQSIRGIPYGVKVDLASDEDFNLEENSLPYGGVLSLSNTTNNSYSIRNSLTFDKNIKENYFSVNVGNEIRSSRYEGTSSTEYGYLPDRGKKFINVDVSTYLKYGEELAALRPSITDSKTNVMSYYGIFSYSYADRYIFNFNIRADGSNKFGEDKSNRFLPVWSVSGRWNIADEKFLDKQNIINQLSLRLSYGVQGNVSSDQVPNLILEMGGYDSYADFNQSYLYKVPNDKLRWEKTNSYDLGIDFALLKNRISGTLELYTKKGKDQIVRTEITSTNGASIVSINDGELTNKGWEIYLRGDIIKTKDYLWSLSFNTGKNYNKVKKAGTSESNSYNDYINGTLISNGSDINTFYSYSFDKLDANGLPTFKNYD